MAPLLLMVTTVMTFLTACNNVELYKPKKTTRNYLLENVLRSRLNELKPYLQANAKKGGKDNFQIAVKDADSNQSDVNGDYDSLLWAGLSCFSGNEEQCEAVKNSQDSEGRFWRSPRRIGQSEGFAFSRDMGLGVLAYLVAKKDVQAALKWQWWLEQKQWKLCSDPKEEGSTEIIGGLVLSDDRCVLYSHNLAIYREVWDYLKLPLPAKLKSPNFELIACNFLGALTQLDQGSRLIPNNFNLHLLATEFLIRIKLYREKALQQPRRYQVSDLGVCGPSVQNSLDLRKILGNFAESPLNYFTHFLVKKQPRNPYFLLLNQEYANAMLEAIAQIENRLREHADLIADPRMQWSFERDTNSFPYYQSMFWEYLFFINLINDPIMVL